VEAHNNLGGVLQLQGQLRPAMEAYEHALELAPDQFYVRSNHLTCLNYHDEADPRDVYEQHRTWAEMLSDTLRDSEDARILRAEPERQLRIGYVSADFRFHSVAFFMSALLEQHDRDGFKVFCYANVPEPDGNTERLTALSDHWRDVSTLHDDEMAAMVRRDSIDILVDLSGHTVGNRLSVFARRPAPIQVTYLGYPNTTGLSVMDYRLTDDITDPRGSSEHLHSEELVRLPHGFLSYQPLPTCPDVRERDGSSGVTFASFNELLKITPPIVDAWCEILERTPNSRLLIKGTTLADEGTRGRVIQRFVENGIAEDRLELIGRTPTLESHLELYNRVDVALDTFPYNGTTTTCEALWMGVPVVSLTGYVHAARVGKSILSAVGLDDLATDDIEAYADCAVALAGDVERRREFRRTLRGRMGASTLMDPSRFTRDLETAFRDMWRRACDEGAKSEVRGDNMATTDTAEAEMLRVNIGGQGAKAGWKVLNILPADYVDYLRDCTDLSCFEDGTVDEFYASHVLEHLGYMGELQQTLREVNRALKPGGVFRISVPDLEVLCRLFIDKRYSAESRFDIMRIIFGGQIDAYDFHKVGLTWENLGVRHFRGLQLRPGGRAADQPQRGGGEGLKRGRTYLFGKIKDNGCFPLQKNKCVPFLDGVLVELAGANADNLVHWSDKDLAVADLSGAGSLGNGVETGLGLGFGNHDLYLHLRQKIDHVLGAAIELRVTLLTSEALDLGGGHSGNTDVRQRFSHVVELEGLDDGFDFLHCCARLAALIRTREVPQGYHSPGAVPGGWGGTRRSASQPAACFSTYTSDCFPGPVAAG
jgi:predicted O-linked N-acetylglucosamine transferase (SPINDLY family)/predicted SAM-dependent methyltransferase